MRITRTIKAIIRSDPMMFTRNLCFFNGTILGIPENFTDAFVTENPCVPKAPGRKNYVKSIKRSSISNAMPHRGNTIVAHCASGGKHCNTAYSPVGAAQMPKTFKRPTESFVKEMQPIVHFVSLVPKLQLGNVLVPVEIVPPLRG